MSSHTRVSVTPTIPEEPEEEALPIHSVSPSATTAPLTFEKVVPRHAPHSSLSMLSSLSLKSLIDARISGRERPPVESAQTPRDEVTVPEGIGAQTPFDDSAVVPQVKSESPQVKNDSPQMKNDSPPVKSTSPSTSHVVESPTASEDDESAALTTQALRKLSVLRLANQGVQLAQDSDSDKSDDSPGDDLTLKMGKSESNFTTTQERVDNDKEESQDHEESQIPDISACWRGEPTKVPQKQRRDEKPNIAANWREVQEGRVPPVSDSLRRERMERSRLRQLELSKGMARIPDYLLQREATPPRHSPVREIVQWDTCTHPQENPDKEPEDPVQLRKAPAQTSMEPVQTSNAPVQTSNAPEQTSNEPVQLRNDPGQLRNAPGQLSNDPGQLRNAPVQSHNSEQLCNTPVQTTNTAPQLSNAPVQTHGAMSRTNVMTLAPRAFPAAPAQNTAPQLGQTAHARTVKQINNPKKAMYVPAVLRNVKDTNLTAGDLQPIPERNTSGPQPRATEPTAQEYLAMYTTTPAMPPNGLHSERDSARGSVHSNASSIYSAYKQRFQELLGGGPRSGNGLKQPTRVHWVPDAERTNCHKCHTRFTILERKHHCRHCGEIFCALDLPDMVYLNGEAHFCQLRQFGGGVLVKVCHSCALASDEYMQEIKKQKLQRLQQQQQDPGNDEGTATPRRGKGMSRGPGKRRESVAGSVPADWNWSSF